MKNNKLGLNKESEEFVIDSQNVGTSINRESMAAEHENELFKAMLKKFEERARETTG